LALPKARSCHSTKPCMLVLPFSLCALAPTPRVRLLVQPSRNTASISLDDFYLTYEEQVLYCTVASRTPSLYLESSFYGTFKAII